MNGQLALRGILLVLCAGVVLRVKSQRFNGRDRFDAVFFSQQILNTTTYIVPWG